MTTAFDAKEALVNLFQGLADFSDLQADDAIWYGYQGQAGNRPRECVWVGEIEWTDEEGAALGGLRRDETYQIMLTVEAHVPGDDQQTANSRVKARVAVIEQALRDYRVLGVSGVYECGLKPRLLGEGADSDGRGAIYVTVVRVRARI